MKEHPFFKTSQFIVMIAAMMGLTAIGIDAVLPAFAELSTAFHLPAERANDIQQVIFVYMLGFASMQLVFGFLSDALGRKSMLCAGITVYILASFWVLFIDNFYWLLIARFFQGVGLAAPRVLSMAVVRDVTIGRNMSRIMSYAMMVFMIVPVLAPFIGQITLKTGDWHNIFWLFIFLGCGLIGWIVHKLPETLPVNMRTPLSFRGIKSALLTCLTHKPTLIYLLMLGMIFGMIMAYISQAEQIFQRDVYALGEKFPLVFALVCSGTIIASYTNSRLVMYMGMHRIVIVALRIMAVNSTVLLLYSFACNGKPPLIVFLSLLIVQFFCQGLIMPNINSLMLEPHRQIAGTASALVGSGMTIIGVILAGIIAGQFNGTLYPLAVGFMVLTVLVCIANYRVNKITAGLE